MAEISGIWRHKRTGNHYFVIRSIQRRLHPDAILQSMTGQKWENAVLYCEDVEDIDVATWYERPICDFVESFERVD